MIQMRIQDGERGLDMQNMPSQKRSRGERLLERLRLFVWPLLIIGVLAYCLCARYYESQTGFVARNGQLLNVVAARGQSITLGLRVDDALGYWASEQGLTLNLKGGEAPLTFVGPKARDWSDTITLTTICNPLCPPNNGPAYLFIQGTITIPSSIGGPEEQVLSATLSGLITYPSSDGIAFTENSLQVTVPVQLHLEPSGSLAWSSGLILFDFSAGLLLLICVGLILLAVAHLRYALVRERTAARLGMTGRSRQEGKQIFRAVRHVAGRLIVGLIPTALCAGVLFGLLLATTSLPDSPQPDLLFPLNLLIPGLFGLSILLGMQALLSGAEQDRRERLERRRAQTFS
jgi:hypothetical protein